VVMATDARGKVTTADYDALRRTVRVDAPLNLSSTWLYDADGFIVETQRFDRGAAHDLPDSSGLIAITRYTYFRTGRPRTVTEVDPGNDSFSRVTTYSYDKMNRQVFATNPEAADQRSYIFDESGHVVTECRAVTNYNAGNCGDGYAYAKWTYSLSGQVLTVKDGQQIVASNGCNANQCTQYAYDGFDRLRSTTFADGTHEDVTTDTFGNKQIFVTRAGDSFDFDYDFLNRMTTKNPSRAGEPTITYAYDARNRQTGVTSSGTGGVVVSYTYDNADRPVSKSRNGLVASYKYDDNGNETRITYPDNWSVDYVYDDLNRMTLAKQHSDGAALATVVYDTLGRVKSVVYDSGATVSRVDAALDRFGETVNLTHTFQGSGTTINFSHAYDKVGRLIATHVSNANWTWIPPANRTLTAVHNALNEVASVTGTGWTPPSSAPNHDLNGNMLGYGTVGVGEWMSYAYDSENRMVSASVNVTSIGSGISGTGAFGYDPVGRRDHALIVGASTRDLYFWTDGDNTIAEYNGAAVGGPWQTSAELRRYVYLPGTYTPFLQIEKATGVRTYLHQDRLGSVIATASATGVKGSVNTYDPYGNVSGSAPTSFGYTGYYYYPELGLYDAHARIYSPFLGRFLQTDPIGYQQSLNLYQYAGGSPNLYTDPSGKFFEEFLAAFILNVALDAIEQLGTNHGRFKIGWNIAFDAAAAIVQVGIGEVVSAGTPSSEAGAVGEKVVDSNIVLAGGGAGPPAQGAAAVDIAMADAARSGFEIVSPTPTTVSVPGMGDRIYDFLMRDPYLQSKTILGVEVKSSIRGIIAAKPDQLAKDFVVTRVGGIATGGLQVHGVYYYGVCSGVCIDVRPMALRFALEHFTVPFTVIHNAPEIEQP